MQLYTSGILCKSEFPKIQFNAIQLNFLSCMQEKLQNCASKYTIKRLCSMYFFRPDAKYISMNF